MEKLAWSPLMSLGAPEIDDAHRALIDKLARLDSLPDQELGDGMMELITELECDFRGEEILMEKIDFPALQSHREQHARVLSALHHAMPDAMNGDCRLARKALELFPQWFMFHLSTMDMALAVALDLADPVTDCSGRQYARTDAMRLIKNLRS